MLRIIEANETEELSELRTVLQKTQLCDAVATLKQFLTLRDGTMNNVEVKQETTPVETTVFLDDNLVRVTLKATIDKSKDILRLRSMWDIALQRGTQKALEGKRWVRIASGRPTRQCYWNGRCKPDYQRHGMGRGYRWN